MLVPIIFIITFMFALAGVLLENSLLAAKIALHDAVARYSDATIADGVADFTHGLASFVEVHGANGPWPQQTSRSASRSACDAVAAAGQCPFRYVITARITNASDDTGTPGAQDAAINLQAAVIDEQRVSAIVTATVTSGAGIVLATRTRFLTYRVFETAPYAVVSGVRDGATVNGAQSAAPGDSGGAAGAPKAATPDEPAGLDDTRIHVRLTCSTVISNVVPFANDQQAAGNDGLPWGNTAQAAYEAPCHSTDASMDVFRDERWTNGDPNVSGWTQ